MKIRKILGYFGLVFAGLSFFLTPSLEPDLLLKGHSALERLKEGSESTEDKLAVEGLIAHSIALGNQQLERKVIGLGVIVLLSVFLIREPKNQNQPVRDNA
jgi:hypothetical protein